MRDCGIHAFNDPFLQVSACCHLGFPEAEMTADQYNFVQKAMRESLDSKGRGTEGRASPRGPGPTQT